jgi:sec-independent protein translocase protein TatA
MFGLGLGELLLILIIALVIFGPSKLPGVGASLGKAMKEFKKAVSDVSEKGGDTNVNADKGEKT